MKELKFRAWCEKEQKYYFTDYLICLHHNDYGVWFTGHHDNHPDFYDDYCDGEVTKLIVEQFTGLHDKNGAEIYEGDILTIRINQDFPAEIDTVRWDAGGWMWRGYILAIIQHDSKVMGNIHETPELLNDRP